VTDQAGLSGQQTIQYVVVYDPTDSFVTGGGWIESPPGAYVPQPELTGRAHFGFISRYEKGATVPSGKTDFRFATANLDFHSTAYDLLVVAGMKAKFKGCKLPVSTLGDGIPDAWKIAHGLDVKDPNVANGDYNHDGYTNLEKYLNELAGDGPSK
jgi:hypothetical protein